ncbi:MAG: M14 family zinc carboxypeptidase, partial [Thermoleophilaceae bacterium]
MRFPTVLLALLALAVPATAGAAAPRFLPPVKERLSDATSVKRTCAADLLSARKRGIDRASYRAPMSGFVNVRMQGKRRPDWDLAVFDATTGRRLASSQAFGSRELAQTWVDSGQRLAIQGCRRSGRSRAVPVSVRLVDVAAPKNLGTPQLVQVDAKTGADLHRLESLGLDVTHQIHNGKADVIVSGAKQRNLLDRAGFSFRTLISDMNAQYADNRAADLAFSRRVGKSSLPSGRTAYRSLVAYQEDMKALVDTYPNRVRPVELPKQTTQGRPIQGVEISSNVNAAEDGRPTWFVVALHHAREWPSAEVAMELATMLANEYGSNARVTNLVDKARIVIVPLINVDSFVFTQQAVSPADTVWYGEDTPEELRPFGADLYTAEQAIGAQAYRRKTCSGAFPAGSPCEVQWGTD